VRAVKWTFRFGWADRPPTYTRPVSISRGFDAEPVRPDPVGRMSGTEEERRVTRTSQLATGTLACPRCDAPVAVAGPVGPADALRCPYCRHAAPVRAFLSLAAPTRPARVAVRVVHPPGRALNGPRA
jgi:hypothetical protein